MPRKPKLKKSSSFKKDFILSYFPKLLITVGASLVILTYSRSFYEEAKFFINEKLGNSYKLETPGKETIVRNVVTPVPTVTPTKIGSVIKIKPINTDFSLVIEKINVNAPIVKDVPIIDKESYLSSLKKGIAHASFSSYPTEENANVYLFAHSSNNFWELGRYSTVFNLLYKLNIGDELNLFYEGKRYVYKVENKILINDFKVDETIYGSLGATLTLQTCYPAGTTLNRLVIKSTLDGIYDIGSEEAAEKNTQPADEVSTIPAKNLIDSNVNTNPSELTN